MVEFLTKYPKTMSFLDGKKDKVKVDTKGVEQLTIVVKKSVEELLKIFSNEGFTHVKFEHKQVAQIGSGLSLKLKKAMGDACTTIRNEKRLCCNTSRGRGFT